MRTPTTTLGLVLSVVASYIVVGASLFLVAYAWLAASRSWDLTRGNVLRDDSDEPGLWIGWGLVALGGVCVIAAAMAFVQVGVGLLVRTVARRREGLSPRSTAVIAAALVWAWPVLWSAGKVVQGSAWWLSVTAASVAGAAIWVRLAGRPPQPVILRGAPRASAPTR